MKIAGQLSIFGLFALGCFGLGYLICYRTIKNLSTNGTEPILAVGRSMEADFKEGPESNVSLDTINQIINQQRMLIQEEMRDYQYPNGMYNISANELADLVIKENGNPIRNIIVSTWRSGSNFLGDVSIAHPGSYFHSEPLLDLAIVRIRGPPSAENALKQVKSLLNCKYAELPDSYMVVSKKRVWNFRRNLRLWKVCEAYPEVCYDRRFLSEMCKLFPFQMTKTVRLRLDVAQELLADEKLVSRMVLLVRDPRGVMKSRYRSFFCEYGVDCMDPALLCADMASDYAVAVELQKKYPIRFRVLRYEDLALEPYKQTEELMKFFGLGFHSNVRRFLDTHTKYDDDNVYFGTSRNSSATVFDWRTKLEFEKVEEIQRSCSNAMKLWGYVPALNATHQKEFIPIMGYDL